jgi:glycosyltransferase involved in cell wall biosynthesis
VTNETFKDKAIHRGLRQPEDVTVVRNGPRLLRDFPQVEADPAIRALGGFVIGYLGIMNPQDHLEVFMEMARIVYIEHRRSDVSFVMVGSGDSFAELQRLRDRKGLTDAVHMTGSVAWRRVLAVLSATDICVQPDPPTAFNTHLTMNKLMEYMALGKAVVAFDMPETRVSGGDCVVYVDGDSPKSLADAVLSLIGDAERVRTLGLKARRRVEDVLAWEHQAGNLLKAYDRLFPGILARGSSQISSEVGG